MFDDYKYLMGSEISNTGNKRMLQGRHYITSWLSLQNADHSTLQPYLVMNLVDGSALVGTHYINPLKGLSDQAEIYTGLYSAFGSHDSEFALLARPSEFTSDLNTIYKDISLMTKQSVQPTVLIFAGQGNPVVGMGADLWDLNTTTRKSGTVPAM